MPELIKARHIIVEDNFLEDPDQLRSVFVERFEDPRRTSRSRFLWDWWHVPNQYTLVRTQVSLQPHQTLPAAASAADICAGC
jgi:hypothetical protein